MGFSAPAELGMGAVRTAGRSKRIDTKVSILLGLQFPLFLRLAKIGERRPLRKWGTAVGLLLRLFRNLFAVHRYLTATHVVYSTQVLDVISRLTSCAALLCRTLWRVADLCSSNLSDTANMRIHGRTKCVPTVEKILCRSLIVSALQISPCYPKGKRESQEGRNLRCLPFWFPRRNRRRSLRFASETLSGFHRKIKSRLPKTPLLF